MTTLNRIYDERIRIATSKWGTHRFTFDEESGNTLDILGNSIGTVTGAERSSGWNGEGRSISFDGTGQRVIFDNQIIPNGPMTVIFKFNKSDLSSDSREVVMTNTLAQNGLTIYFHFNGTLVFDMSTSGNNKVFAVGIPITNYLDGQWHTVMMTYDATINPGGLNIYLNDELYPTYTGSANMLPVAINENLSMGYNPTPSNTLFTNFNGKIDEFQVYNRVLTPQDFFLNKNLILNNGVYQTYNGTWEDVSSSLPTVEQFLTNGIDNLTPLLDRVNGSSPLDEITNEYIIVNWTDEVNSRRELQLNVSQSPQLVYANSDISLAGVESVDSILLTSSGDTRIGVSFDGGLNYQTYKNGSWESIIDASEGMTVSELNSLNAEQINLGRGESNFIRFSYYITPSSIVDRIVLSVTLQGEERILPTSDYALSYDYANGTIIYNINRDMTLSVNYVDGD